MHKHILIFALVASLPALAVNIEDSRSTFVLTGGTTSTCPNIAAGYVDTEAASSVGVDITVAGGFDGTVAFRGSMDGTALITLSAFPTGSTTPVTTATASGTWTIQSGGMRWVCAYLSSAGTVGTATVNMNATLAEGAVQGKGIPVAINTLPAGGVANDTTAISTGLETQPAVSRATPTATTAGRSEKLQVQASGGGLFAVLANGGTIADVAANASAAPAAGGLFALPATATTTPTAVTATWSSALQMEAASGKLYVTAGATAADPCQNVNIAKSSVPINIGSATTTALVAVSGSTTIYVCGYSLSLTGAVSITTALLEYGTGGVCGTGTTALTGTMGASLTTSAELLQVPTAGTVVKTAASKELCLLSAGNTPSIQGYLTYVQQ